MATIVTAGEILVELMAERVGQGFLEPGRWLGPYPSGAPAILADQAARCGADVAMLGCVGQDDFGALNLTRLRSAGVDVSGIARVPAPTGSAFVSYHDDGRRDFVFNIADSAAGRLRHGHVEAAVHLFDGCRWFHVMGSSLISETVSDAIERAAELARARGARISLDPNVRKELLARPGASDALARLAARADLLLASEDDLAHLAPGLDEGDAAARLLDGGASRVVVKRGARGCASHARGEPAVEQGAFVVDEIDPTGAGDCFGGTLLACLCKETPIAAALRRAAAAGALAVRRQGPMEGNTDLDAIERFLASGPSTG